MYRILATSLALLSYTGGASAQSVALLLGTEDYERVSDVRRGDDVIRAARDLEGIGVRVVQHRDPVQRDLEQALAEFGQMVENSDRLLVALSGRFVHSVSETYYLPANGDAGPLATLAGDALPLSTVLAFLASKPGKAVLVLATDRTNASYGRHLSDGIGDIDIPQGVLVISLGARDAARFIEDGIAQPGIDMVAFARRGGHEIDGYTAPGQIFVSRASIIGRTSDNAAQERLRDIRAWRDADAVNTVAAYQKYLQTHPRGQFRRMAASRIEAMTETPQARAERAEQALGLNRNQRRAIQRNLSLLDFNTRGIDGIFGRGTRAAIKSWQQAQNFASSGYLTGDQIEVLNAQAEAKAAELEAEAELRRAEILSEDQAFWEQTGARGEVAGLRVYLSRYPDGEFSEQARAQLLKQAQQKRRSATAQDRARWDRTVQANTIEAYRAYLQQSPNGVFRDDAETRIKWLRRDQERARENSAAARAEQALNLSPRTTQVIESRLEGLGLRPGKVDGVLDDDSRRAIRRYQSARDMPETGYLSEQVVVQLLADSVRQIFR